MSLIATYTLLSGATPEASARSTAMSLVSLFSLALSLPLPLSFPIPGPRPPLPL